MACGLLLFRLCHSAFEDSLCTVCGCGWVVVLYILLITANPFFYQDTIRRCHTILFHTRIVLRVWTGT